MSGTVQHPLPTPGLLQRRDKTTSLYSPKNKQFFHKKRALDFHWKTFNLKPMAFRSLEHYTSPWAAGVPHLLAPRATTLRSVHGTGCSQTQAQHGLECAKFEVHSIVKLSPCELLITLKF